MYIHSLQLDFTILILPKIQKKEDESPLPINNTSDWVPIHSPTFPPQIRSVMCFKLLQLQLGLVPEIRVKELEILICEY